MKLSVNEQSVRFHRKKEKEWHKKNGNKKIPLKVRLEWLNEWIEIAKKENEKLMKEYKGIDALIPYDQWDDDE